MAERRGGVALIAFGVGLAVLYVVLAGVVLDVTGATSLGPFALGLAGGVAVVVLAWSIAVAARVPSMAQPPQARRPRVLTPLQSERQGRFVRSEEDEGVRR
jgi:hypothetical protein